MKKVLILGAGGYQLTAIKKLKTLGYQSVVVSNLATDIGVAHADFFENVSTLDCDQVLKIAEKHEVDAVYTIASEVASLTVAKVAKKLGSIWLSDDQVSMLSNKQLFNELTGKVEPIDFPKVVKPAISSGSRGVAVVNTEREEAEAITTARSFSLNNECVVEAYIQGDHFGASFQVVGEKIVYLHVTEKVRDENNCTLAHISNTRKSKSVSQAIFKHLQETVTKLGLSSGFFDGDLVVSIDGSVHVVELGSRLGGNGIAELVELADGYDIISASIKYAVGSNPYPKKSDVNHLVASVVLRSVRAGQYCGMTALPDQIETRFFIKKGDRVSVFQSGADQVGVAFVHAKNEKELRDLVALVLDTPIDLD